MITAQMPESVTLTFDEDIPNSVGAILKADDYSYSLYIIFLNLPEKFHLEFKCQ